jgi:hypothetical protein
MEWRSPTANHRQLFRDPLVLWELFFGGADDTSQL